MNAFSVWIQLCARTFKQKYYNDKIQLKVKVALVHFIINLLASKSVEADMDRHTLLRPYLG